MRQILLILTMLLIVGCATNDNIAGDVSYSDVVSEINIDKLEIYHFHSDRQCISCVTVGDYADETVNTYFKDELDKGIIVFDHINTDLLDNKLLAMKYQVTGSSLWLGTYNGEDFKAEENVNVWYKIKDKNAYMDYLKKVIEDKLAGN